MTRVAITGAFGFLGWHTACRLRAIHGVESIRLGRAALADPVALDNALSKVDAVLHLAGVNRAETDEQVESGNADLAEALASAVSRQSRPVDVVYSNSIQATLDSPYGRAKRAAARTIGEAVRKGGGRFADVLLPNLFGEHGRPNYNSFVATFAHTVVLGEEPKVTADNEVSLLHAQGGAAALIDALGTTGRTQPSGEPHGVAEVASRLQAMHELYSAGGQVPPLTTTFDVDLFNTYRAAVWDSRPGLYPMSPQVHSDPRGGLFEAVRAHGGTGQAFVSTTRPGQLRGDHYHLHKVERFLVVQGEAEIGLRRLLHDKVTTFRLSGERPSFVDMPTMWVHNIRNVGDQDLVTVFWADQLLDADNPDQYPEKVMRP